MPFTKKPRFIVIEGIDGAGIETQGKLLFDYLRRQKKPVERLYYPDYGKPIGRLIHQYLHKEYNLIVDVQFLLYFADFVKDKPKINKWLREKKIVIGDRYFTSTIAYQGLRNFPIGKALKIAEMFSLPKPDLAIYLKVSPDVSIKRKFKEKNSLDRNEADKKLLAKVGRFYEKLIRDQIFCKWVVVDGEDSIENVFDQIKKLINTGFSRRSN